MRVVSVLAALGLVVGLAACGGGGGPSDLTLASTPTTVTTSTTIAPASSGGVTTATPVNGSASAALPPYASLVARATGARLAVYNTPNATKVARRLLNPWLAVPGNASTKVPQVLFVLARQTDWVKVLLPVHPNGSTGWVHATDVTVGQISYRMQITLSTRRLAVFNRGAVIYQGPIAISAAAKATPAGRYFLHRVFSAPASQTSTGPYAYGLIKQLAVMLPLGTPVDIAA